MDNHELLKYAEGLFKEALSKTHNIDEAEDLVQDTYLQAFIALSKNKEIQNPKAYLNSILNNRFYMLLRKKYKLPVVYYGQMPVETMDEQNANIKLYETDESETLRRELAFLSYTYREVMVRYYIQEKSVEQIAAELCLPKGTVCSRLDIGRKKVKKGVEKMQNYTNNSYQPEILNIGINGRTGLDHEPFSCVKGLMDQNILILSYEDPVTLDELSKALGVPMAFVEERVDNLLRAELMKKQGTKVYTDFVILSLQDSLKSLQISKQFAQDTFDIANNVFLKMVKEYKTIKGFAECENTYLYIMAVLSCRQNFSGRIAEVLSGKDEVFENYPDRPNYGKWIALGSRYPHGYNFNDERAKYNVSGRSGTDNINEEIVHECEWDIPIGHTHQARFKYGLKQHDRVLAIDAFRTDTVNTFCAELIPELESQGFIKTVNGKKTPAVPYIRQDDVKRFLEIESSGADEWCSNLLDKAVTIARNNIVKYPKRIKNVTGIVYDDSMFYLPMAYIYEAEKHGIINIEKEKCYPIMYIVTK